VTIFEDQHGLRLVGHRSLGRRGCCSLGLSLGAARPLGICVRVRGCRLARTAAVEDGGASTVVFFPLGLWLVREIVGFGITDHHRVSIRYVNRPAAGEKLSAAMMMITLATRRIHRK
jgi:hypothetical protein